MNEIPTIHFETDRICPQCGAKGAVRNGVCFECANKNLRRKMALFINDSTVYETIQMLNRHMIAHQEEMDTTYAESDDEDNNRLDVTLKVGFESKDGGVNIKTSIAFTTGKISEKDEKLTFPNQKKLEGME